MQYIAIFTRKSVMHVEFEALCDRHFRSMLSLDRWRNETKKGCNTIQYRGNDKSIMWRLAWVSVLFLWQFLCHLITFRGHVLTFRGNTIQLCGEQSTRAYAHMWNKRAVQCRNFCRHCLFQLPTKHG